MFSEIMIVNGGMPVTVIGLVNPIDPRKIQGTIASLVAAAVQAVEEQRTGLLPLNAADSQLIMDNFATIERSSGWIKR
jgi:hypothetical protein